MNDLTLYNSVKTVLRPGDIIVFAGTEPISWAIRLFTGSPLSHTAMVRQRVHQGSDVVITQCDLNSKHNGAQSCLLGAELEGYGDGASAAALLLRDDFRKSLDWGKFYEFIGAAETYVHYDVAGLFGFLARELPVMGPYILQSEDPHQMFCNAYCIAIFEACEGLRGINYRKMSPQDLAEMAIYEKAVPLMGKPLKIRHFNSV